MRNAGSRKLWILVLFIGISLSSLMGCASREDDTGSPPKMKASLALAKAEQAMKDAGVFVDFNNQGGLEVIADLQRVLPNPADLSSPETQGHIETAIEAFYETLDALEETGTPSVPTEAEAGISKTDSMLLHFHLAYLYTLAAVSRLARTGGDLFFVAFRPVENTAVYQFRLTPKGEALVDSIDLKQDPLGIIKTFNEEQRQAIIDALMLLTGAEVVILNNPQAGIKAQRPQIDRSRCRANAFVHLQQSVEVGGALSLEIQTSLIEFDKLIAEAFSKEMLAEVKGFGFEIRTVPEQFESAFLR